MPPSSHCANLHIECSSHEPTRLTCLSAHHVASPFSSPIPQTPGRCLSANVDAASTGPSVHTHSRERFFRPATGVAGHVSLSSSSDDSRLSPVWGDLTFLSFAFVLSLRTSPSLGVWSFSVSGGDSSNVEMVDIDDSMSECRIVYRSVVMSSVSGARKATFFAAGNIGLDCANARLWFIPALGSGLLVKIEVTLYASLYGTAADSEPIVDTEVAEHAVDDVVSECSEAAGDNDLVSFALILDVARFDNVGRLGLEPGTLTLGSSSCALLKVFRIVGDVAESVSSRRLVAFLPNVDGRLVVLSDSFGRLDGFGADSKGG
jgi:hypothetical protein